MMLAEASKPELLTNAFDLDYSWPMLHALNDVLLRGAPASRLHCFVGGRHNFLGLLFLSCSPRAVGHYATTWEAHIPLPS